MSTALRRKLTITSSQPSHRLHFPLLPALACRCHCSSCLIRISIIEDAEDGRLKMMLRYGNGLFQPITLLFTLMSLLPLRDRGEAASVVQLLLLDLIVFVFLSLNQIWIV